jgi:hypothetical protein
MIRRLLASIAALCLSLTPTISMASQETDRLKMSDAHQRVYDASLALYGELGEVGHFLCTSTVFARKTSLAGGNEYLLLTAGHCVVGADLPTDLKFYVSEQIVDQPIIGNAKLQSVDVVSAENDDKYDFAILHLVSNKDYPVIPLAERNIVPQIEDKVYTINFSLGLAKQVALGVVATNVITNGGSENECAPCKGRYLVHLFAGPGASGSAVVDEKTNTIVGVGELGFPGQTLGLGVETMASFWEWAEHPITDTSSPKA